ncbi:MAG: hypothetical protein ABL957_07435 [Parvularculaceae bacterium]
MPAMIEARTPPAQSLPGEEDLRFIRNFHDIFLSIGILMFAAGLGLATSIALGPTVAEAFGAGEEGWRRALTIIAGAAGANAVVMWLMAEFFTRGRRLFLPSIVILVAFVGFFFVAAAASYGAFVGFDRDLLQRLNDSARPAAGESWAESAIILEAIREGSEAVIVILGATTAAILAFYLRMKLPFAMGVFALYLSFVGVAAAYNAWPDRVLDIAEPAQLLSGAFLFLLGVMFDARDPDRKTRLSDNGFWLHFFAAPLILNASLGMLIGVERVAENPTGAALVTLGVVTAFSFVSLLINRRALLVAGLLYALIAAGYLISKTGLSGAWTIAVTLLSLGGAMVLLGGGWHAIRRIVVAPFPKRGFLARIIPPEPSKEDRAEAVTE